MSKELLPNHPLLAGLQALWNLPDELLNKVLWANTSDGDRERAIGYANEYIEFMESICETTDPAAAWEAWCEENNIDHEIDNNPYK